MTDIQKWLDQGRALADKATEGPWEVEESSDGWTEIYGRDPIGPITPTVATTERGGEDEAAFIADSRTRLPQALNALQAILDLHQNLLDVTVLDGTGRTMFTRRKCSTCSPKGGYDAVWPCPTVEAIQDAIKEPGA